jgi:molybdate transport system substrate-binding protein
MASRPRALSASCALACLFATTLSLADGPSHSLTILAAASLSDVLPQIAGEWRNSHRDIELKLSFDGSSRLAKEIEEGVVADVFISADLDWMDELQAKKQIETSSRRNLLGNEIVLIVPSNKKSPESISDLRNPVFKKIALAGENVPISKYAKSALEKAGIWGSIESKMIRGDNVRTDLKWVEEGEADAGIVYWTDALNDQKVKIAFAFPKDSYPTVVYPGAVIASSKSRDIADEFLGFCQSLTAQNIFSQNGFLPFKDSSPK